MACGVYRVRRHRRQPLRTRKEQPTKQHHQRPQNLRLPPPLKRHSGVKPEQSNSVRGEPVQRTTESARRGARYAEVLGGCGTCGDAALV